MIPYYQGSEAEVRLAVPRTMKRRFSKAYVNLWMCLSWHMRMWVQYLKRQEERIVTGTRVITGGLETAKVGAGE